jgi:hypothetical protein
LVDDYLEERRMDARAGPFVLLWLVSGTVLWWGTNWERPALLNVAGVAATLLSMGLGVAVIRLVRGRVMWWVDRRLDVLDTFSLAPLIALPSSLIEGSRLLGIVNGLNALLGIAEIYAVVGLGLIEIGLWSLGRLSRELARIVELLSRTLPILLILVLFLLFADELWEAAHFLSSNELLAVILLLLLIAALLVVTAFRTELVLIESLGWEELRPLASDTPAGPLATVSPTISVPRLRFRERLNLLVLVLISELIQSAFVALLVTGILMIFGLIMLPAALQESWVGDPVVALESFQLLGETRTLSVELVTTAALLGSVVGLYFTGLSVTDTAYRRAHFGLVIDEVRQLVAARAFYSFALRRIGPASAGPSGEADSKGQ